MTTSKQQSRRDLRQALITFHLARVRLRRAIKEVERHVYRTDMPLSLRKQAD